MVVAGVPGVLQGMCLGGLGSRGGQPVGACGHRPTQSHRECDQQRAQCPGGRVGTTTRLVVGHRVGTHGLVEEASGALVSSGPDEGGVAGCTCTVT